jgi:hypothetical protein
VGDLRGLGTRAGRLGDGGGEKKRWLKLYVDEVAESGPLSSRLYEPVLRRLSLGGATMRREWDDPGTSRCVFDDDMMKRV